MKFVLFTIHYIQKSDNFIYKHMKSKFSAILIGIALLGIPATAGSQELRKSTEPDPGSELLTRAGVEKCIQSPRVRTGVTTIGGIQTSGRIQRLHKLPNHVMKAPQLPEGFYGSLLYANSNELSKGIYAISTTGSAQGIIFASFANGGGMVAKGTYYLNWLQSMSASGITAWHNAYKIKTTGLSRTINTKFTNPKELATDMAYLPTLDRGYSYVLTDTRSSQLGWFSLSDFSYKTIGTPVNTKVVGLAGSEAGKLYAIDDEGLLYDVDPMTGAIAKIGDTGLKSTYSTSATFEETTGKILYGLQTDNDAALYRIDPTTAKAEFVYDFPLMAQFVGLGIDRTSAQSQDAPAAVAAVNASVAGGEMTATVNFTLPVKTVGGATLDTSKDLTYEILVNNKVEKTSTGKPGDAVTMTYAAPESANYSFSVVVRNAAGASTYTATTIYIGNDAPGLVSGVKLAWNYKTNTMTVDWSAVSTAANNGYVDYSKITYRVTRYPGAVVVADAVAALTFDDVIEVPQDALTEFYYTVAATFDGRTGEPSASNPQYVGVAQLPFETDVITSMANYNGFTIVPNPDAATNNTWDYYSMAFRGYNGAWLFTPSIYLEPDKLYALKFQMRGSTTTRTEKYRVVLTTEPDASTQVRTIYEATVRGAAFQLVNTMITVEKAGVYNLGFNDYTGEAGAYVMMKALSIGKGYFVDAPKEPTALNITSYVDGSDNAVVSFITPTQNYANGSLPEITSTRVYRDGELVKTFATCRPGAQLTFTDGGMSLGYHDYKVVCYYGEHDGVPTEGRAYIGINLPMPPENAVITETGKPGEITVSWDAVTTDIEGNELRPNMVSYTIVDANGIVAEGIHGNSHTFQAVEPGKQDYVQYLVYASTDAGNSYTYALTPLVPVGTPYELDYIESFANGRATTVLAQGPNSEDVGWALLTDADGVPASDGDNGFVASFGYDVNDYASLTTGKINIGDAARPMLSFNYYAFSSDAGNRVMVYIHDYTDPENEGKWTNFSCAGARGWHRAAVDLSAYKGKVIAVLFRTVITAYTNTLLDNIRVYNSLENNIEGASIVVPPTIKADRPAIVTATFNNAGTNKVSGYKVELYHNGELYQTVDGPDIEPAAAEVIPFTVTLGVASGETHKFYAKAVYDADEKESDNTTAEGVARLILPDYPTLTIAGETTDNGDVVLTWDAPELVDAKPMTVTDDFEDYDSWATMNIGDWTLVDGDGLNIGGVSSITMPGVKGQQSFFVFDSDGLNYTFESHSGTKHMASLFPDDDRGSQCDDWLISPELSGKAQTVEFYAKSYSEQYEETIEVLYSTGSLNPDDFVSLGVLREISASWTLFTAVLPAGAKYFAIRNISDDCYMLFVDDVTMEIQPMNYELKGYNVYRDGVKLNTELLTTTGYTDAGVGDERHTYVVTAVYDKGESAPSNEYVVNESGIGAITTSQLSIIGGEGKITVNGATGLRVMVAAVDGRVIADAVAADNRMELPVASGIYAVKAGNKAVKVIVR